MFSTYQTVALPLVSAIFCCLIYLTCRHAAQYDQKRDPTDFYGSSFYGVEKQSIIPKVNINTSREPTIRSAAQQVVDASKYFTGTVDCFSDGTIVALESGVCVCRAGWNGPDCAFPDAVWGTHIFHVWYSAGLIKRRKKPRTVVNGLILDHQLDLLEIRLEELGDAVDHYVIVESNYTYLGSAKPLHLQAALRAGFLRKYVRKIIPLTLTVFDYGDANPWAHAKNLRSYLWRESQTQLYMLQKDDIIVMPGVDEIPSRDVLLFLKHHDGYGEPISFSLRSFLYGFFWESKRPTRMRGACTVEFLRNAYNNDTSLLQNVHTYFVSSVSRDAGTVNHEWTITGSAPRYSGWHCSWCFDAQGIQAQLEYAQRDDGRSWKGIVERMDLDQLKTLRARGLSLDKQSPLSRSRAYDAAPAYVRNNFHRFRYLMAA